MSMAGLVFTLGAVTWSYAMLRVYRYSKSLDPNEFTFTAPLSEVFFVQQLITTALMLWNFAGAVLYLPGGMK